MMTRPPSISVVIPSLNQGRFLSRTLESVRAQRYPNLQVIIVDGGSTDCTRDVVQRYGDIVSTFIMERDSGQSEALNKGFALASGDVLAWQNADDTYVEGSFAAVAEVFAQGCVDIVFGDWWEIDDRDRKIERMYAFDFDVWHLMYEGFTCNIQAYFWTRDVYTRFGRFDENLHRTMDYDALIRFGLMRPKLVFRRLPDALACFRRHAEQKTRGFDEKLERELAYVRQKHLIGEPARLHARALRTFFRFRRAFWYFRRGGLRFLFAKAFAR